MCIDPMATGSDPVASSILLITFRKDRLFWKHIYALIAHIGIQLTAVGLVSIATYVEETILPCYMG